MIIFSATKDKEARAWADMLSLCGSMTADDLANCFFFNNGSSDSGPQQQEVGLWGYLLLSTWCPACSTRFLLANEPFLTDAELGWLPHRHWGRALLGSALEKDPGTSGSKNTRVCLSGDHSTLHRYCQGLSSTSDSYILQPSGDSRVVHHGIWSLCSLRRYLFA